MFKQNFTFQTLKVKNLSTYFLTNYLTFRLIDLSDYLINHCSLCTNLYIKIKLYLYMKMYVYMMISPNGSFYNEIHIGVTFLIFPYNQCSFGCI
jgi:hypothetical protein